MAMHPKFKLTDAAKKKISESMFGIAASMTFGVKEVVDGVLPLDTVWPRFQDMFDKLFLLMEKDGLSFTDYEKFEIKPYVDVHNPDNLVYFLDGWLRMEQEDG